MQMHLNFAVSRGGKRIRIRIQDLNLGLGQAGICFSDLNLGFVWHRNTRFDMKEFRQYLLGHPSLLILGITYVIIVSVLVRKWRKRIKKRKRNDEIELLQLNPTEPEPTENFYENVTALEIQQIDGTNDDQVREDTNNSEVILNVTLFPLYENLRT
ncbi:hypothetical protein FQA39_LY02002 [Lamprigera yunnana]|nr:hypothetical protein FQA39_LY02002 [Lamprigera yunnana]